MPLALCLLLAFKISHPLAQETTVQPDFTDELSAIGAGKADRDAKAAKITPDIASSPSPSVDFSSELRDISGQQRSSSPDGWREDIKDFKQGIASIKEQKRLNEIKALGEKCRVFWTKADTENCKPVYGPRTIVLTAECNDYCLKKRYGSKCRRFKGGAFLSCVRSHREASKEMYKQKKTKAAEVSRQRARERKIQCQKERTYCKGIKEEVQRGVLPKVKYPSWTPSDKRAATLASESLNIVIEPKLGEAISLQKEQDQRQSEHDRKAVQQAEKQRLIQSKKETRASNEEAACRLQMQKNDAVSCACLKYLPDRGAGATGCGK